MSCLHPLERLQLLLYWRRHVDHSIYCRECDTYFPFPDRPGLSGRLTADILTEWRAHELEAIL